MTILPWALCGVLLLALTIVYRRGIRQQVQITALTVEMIMSDRERAAQRDLLYKFVRASHYKDADSLAGAVANGIATIAFARAHITMPANRGYLMDDESEFRLRRASRSWPTRFKLRQYSDF